jgi:hypothetical protein
MGEYIHLSIPREVSAAIEKKAQAAGLTRHAWSLAALDGLVGRAEPPDNVGQSERPKKPRLKERYGRASIHPNDSQMEAYKRAADKCHMTVATWANITLGVLSGASELGEQLKKVA